MEQFKDKHKGEDIYIIASSKTLDFFDCSFFDNKITIGINQVYKKKNLNNINYLVRKDPAMIKNAINHCKNTIHFISKGRYGQPNDNNKKMLINNFKSHLGKDIIIYGHEKNNHTKINLPQNPNHLVVSWSTITTGIHLGAYMGAKNIILVGHDCGTLDGKNNFEGYHTKESMSQKNDNEYTNWLKKIENQTLTLKRLLKEKYNCNIYSLNPFINYGLEGHVYKR